MSWKHKTYYIKATGLILPTEGHVMLWKKGFLQRSYISTALGHLLSVIWQLLPAITSNILERCIPQLSLKGVYIPHQKKHVKQLMSSKPKTALYVIVLSGYGIFAGKWPFLGWKFNSSHFLGGWCLWWLSFRATIIISISLVRVTCPNFYTT